MIEGGRVLSWFGGLGPWEIGIVGGVIVLLFFGRRIPEVMRSLGKGITEFKKGLHDSGDEGGADAAAQQKELPAPKKDVVEVETRREETADAPSKPPGRDQQAR